MTVSIILSSCDSLLVVCNTKKEAAFLFESLQAENCRCFHLSAAMCMQHRRETLQALQSALGKPSADRQRVVCVSTQVIEAGVDISFQRVIRFSAGMDSVVQAAGRCNRHAEQKKPAPVRLIRCTDERLRGLDDIVRGQNATTALLTAFSKTPEAFRHDLSSEEAIRFYYRRLYAEMEPGFQDDQTQAHGSLYHLLADNPRYADANCAQAERYFLRQAFRLAGTLFQVFDEDTSALLVPYGRGCELQNTLRNAAQVYGQKDWAVIRGCIDGAKGYCVSVYRYQLERLESLGAVTSLFDGGILLLSDGFYNEHTRFSLEAGRVITYVRTQIACVDPADYIAVFYLIAGTAVVGEPAVDLVHPAGLIAYIKLIEIMLRLEALIKFSTQSILPVADAPDPEQAESR